MANKQIPGLPPLDEAPADDDRFVVRDTSSGSDKSLRVDRMLDRSADQVDAHAEEQGGIHGIPEGERALHTGDDSDALSDIPEGERALHTGTDGGGTPIGGYVTVQTDLTGAEEPDPATYIKLEAGLTGGGQYNEGKLDNESVSGSAPLVEATAEIVDAESPLNGQTVHLLETERRYLMPGDSPGTVAFDQMQQITGKFAGGRDEGGGSTALNEGAFSLKETSPGVGDGESTIWRYNFDSANSPDARTGDHTNVKHIEVAVYMRIK